MLNKTYVVAGRRILKEFLPRCTEGEQMMFRRMYCHKHMDLTIEQAVDQMDPEKIETAISQVERTLDK
jgi:hypothetical protein